MPTPIVWRRMCSCAAEPSSPSSGMLKRMVSAGNSNRELCHFELTELSALIQKKSVSPVEATNACLARIEKLNLVLNAYITVTAESALGAAKKAEAEITRGAWRGPLHGVPIAMKDLVETAGVRTTAASGVLKDYVPTQDAEIVRRLKGAGAVLLGKLNLQEFAYARSRVLRHPPPAPNPSPK